MMELRRVNAQLPTTALPVMTKSYPLPSYAEAAEWFCYCPETGLITWAQDRWYNAKAGDVAGSVCPVTGYRRIRFGAGAKLQAHRLAWLLHYRIDPYPYQVDHIDRDRLNNQIANLRTVTAAQNQFNRSLNSNNTTGFKGVYKCRERWRAIITHHGARLDLGLFDSPEQAAAAWASVAKDLRAEFFTS